MAALLPSKRQQSYSKVFKADLFGLMFLIRKGQKNKPIESTSKCSMGWFFGFKLHLICNERGELLNFMVTPGDVDNAYAQPRALPWAMCNIWAYSPPQPFALAHSGRLQSAPTCLLSHKKSVNLPLLLTTPYGKRISHGG